MNRKRSFHCLLQRSVPSKPWEILHLDVSVITAQANNEILIAIKL